MRNESFDYLVIGSGAGGAAAAFWLTRAGARVLLVERGTGIPRTRDTLDPAVVIEEGRYKGHDEWRDARGRRLVPEETFNVGGKTKWFGAALMRAAPHEFAADPAAGCRGWPFEASALNAWYAEAERLLDVRTFPCEPALATLTAGLESRGWRSYALPMGLHADILTDPAEASHFDGFASPRGLKSDAEVRFIEPALRTGRLTLLTNAHVEALLPSSRGARHVGGARLADGRILRAPHVLLAAGALHSPRLLARYLDEHALAHLPVRGNVGRHLKLHLLTALIVITQRVTEDLLRKTVALTHPEFPHSSVQPLGFDGELIARLMPRMVPRAFARQVGKLAYGFFLQTEDASHPDNRVDCGADGVPVIDYEPRRSPLLDAEHRQLTRRLRADLFRAGGLAFAQRIGITGTAHACGTLAAGHDPATSVVDPDGRVHGLEGLHVVDGSVLARSGSVNPSLTIVAWSLKVAAHLVARIRRAA